MSDSPLANGFCSDDFVNALGLRIFGASPSAMALLSVDGRVAAANRAFEKLLRLDAAEATGETLASLALDGVGRLEAALAALVEGGSPGERLEARLRDGDGEGVWVQVTLSALRDDTGRAEGLLAVLEDRAPERQAEEALRESERQLQQAKKMEAVGRLAGGVAHDFNNVLTAIMGFNDLVLERLGPQDPLFKDASEIRNAAIRASGLTRQLLTFTRRQVIQPRPLDLNALVSNLESMLRRLIGENVVLVTNLADELDWVHADPGQLEQVLLNLVVNARDAMPDGGRIAITTENAVLSDVAYAKLTVSDTGCGMDEKVQAHLFEPFFTTKEEGRGTGLGLATVYGVVQHAKGQIRVESQPGFGTSFEICLPATAERPVEGRPTSEEASKLGGSETVLLVEDESTIRELASRFLTRSGYQVLEAADGAEALLKLEKHPDRIDLLVTDVVMPQLTGPELAEHAKDSRPDMRVLYISGYTGDTPVVERIASSGAQFLQKPFPPEALLRKVRSALDA